jgi:UDP-N-acetylglucosamine diphosphorylase / glucose-1-phosphate thymidylyltransferase / UDP-N-acetylgalactosamine diphosphorylase / glucosamine-1-phosphate N-acetyltransferase / galactosamine-1-phosphate N-acetyltransferase
MNLTNISFFDLSRYAHASLFVADEYPWQALVRLKAYMADYPWPQVAWPQNPGPLPATLILHETKLSEATADCTIEFGDAAKGSLRVFRNGTHLEGASVLMAGAVLAGGPLSIGRGVLVESGAFIRGPVIIGDQSEVRQGAYLRGHCLVGVRCVVGHVTEVKHAIFLDDAKAGHFAYLGDSILGNEVNLGAGTKLANLRFTSGDVLVKTPAGPVDTGLRKFGAILGDKVQTGCNAVTNPGTVLGRKSIVLPNTTVPSGWHLGNSLIR